MKQRSQVRSSVSRRTWIGATSATLVAVAIGSAPAASAQFEFRAASSLPVDHPSSVRARQMWAAIERESEGRIRTEFFPNSALGGDAAMLAQLRSGALHFMIIAPGTFASVVPAADITNVGFVFATPAHAFSAVDGPLGDYIRSEIPRAGLHPLRKVWDSGMRDIASSSRAIHVADDLNGFKIRVVESRLTVDLFSTLGASPVPLSFSELYTALQTKIVDGCDMPLGTLESGRFYEVQRYLSLTNHTWSALWMLANAAAWSSLPANLQEIVERNNTRFALLERHDSVLLNASAVNDLRRQGLAVNTAEAATFRTRLSPYYRRSKAAFGTAEWALLQESVGKTLA